MRIASLFFSALLVFFGITTYHRNTHYSKMNTLWQPIIEKHPDYSRALAIMSNANLLRGNFGKALELGEKAMRNQPYDASMYRTIGNIYSMKHEWKKAAPYYSQAIMLRKTWKSLELLSVCLLHLNQYPRALKAIQEARRLEPLRPDAALLEAGIHSAMGNRTEAIRCADEADQIGIQPGRYRQIGEMLTRIHKEHSAAYFFKRALEITPKDTASLLALGNYHLKRNQYKQAHNYFVRMLDINPGDRRALLLIADTFHQAGLFRKAADVFSAFPVPDRTIHFNAGLNYLYAGQSAKAVRYFSLVLNADPENGDATLNMGIAYMLGDTPAKALPWLEKARTMKPDSPRVWTNLGDYYSRTENLSRAEECFRKAIALDPAHVKARLMFANFLYRKRNKKEDAIAILNDGVNRVTNPADKEQLQDEVQEITNTEHEKNE